MLSLGALSLPVAAALDSERPWWNYGAWTWLENDKAITFDWTHRYGPLDWPRDGTTLLNVKADRPHYWKAETLDTFDGVRWVRGRHQRRDAAAAGRARPRSRRTTTGTTSSGTEVGRGAPLHGALAVDRACSSSAGTPYVIEGAGLVSTSSDGTTQMADRPLTQGDSYTVRTYAPEPDRRARCAGRRATCRPP